MGFGTLQGGHFPGGLAVRPGLAAVPAKSIQIGMEIRKTDLRKGACGPI